MTEQPQPSSPAPAAPAKKRGCLVPMLVVVGVVVLGARIAAPWFVKTQVLPGAGRAAGVTIACDDVSLGVVAGRVTLSGVVVTGRDGGAAPGDELIRAGTATANVDVGSLFGGAPVLDELVLEDAHATVVVLPDGKTNIDKVLEAQRAGRGPAAAVEESLPGIVVRSLRLSRCAVTILDPARVKGPAAEIRAIEVRGADVVLGKTPAGAPPMTLDLDAKLAQGKGAAPISVIAWTKPADAAANGAVANTGGDVPLFVHAALTDLDLAAFPAYVDGTQKSILGADRIDVAVSAGVRGGRFTQGAAIGRIPGRAEPLSVKFSGDVQNPTVDASGSMAALFELPFARCGRVGTVVWETGSSVVGGATDIAGDLAKGDVAGAGGRIVSGIGGALRKAGDGLTGAAKGLGSALGLGGKDGAGQGGAARDVAAVHHDVRAAFLSLRRDSIGVADAPASR